MRLRLVPLLVLLASPAAWAASRPTFGVAFDATAEYLRIHKGTQDGLVNDYLGEKATTGLLRDALEREVGTFATVHADDFETVVRVTGYADGKSLADVDHVAVPALKIGFLPYKVEPKGLLTAVKRPA